MATNVSDMGTSTPAVILALPSSRAVRARVAEAIRDARLAARLGPAALAAVINNRLGSDAIHGFAVEAWEAGIADAPASALVATVSVVEDEGARARIVSALFGD